MLDLLFSIKKNVYWYTVYWCIDIQKGLFASCSFGFSSVDSPFVIIIIMSTKSDNCEYSANIIIIFHI